MSFIVTDLRQLYRNVFGGAPYVINGQNTNVAVQDQIQSRLGNVLQTKYLGKDVWLPVRFVELDPTVFPEGQLVVPYCTVRVSGRKTIIKTPLVERRGTVKEVYNVDDYQIELRGFAIDEQQRQWPEEQLLFLKLLFENNQAVSLDNALTNLFLKDSQQRVVIERFDLGEVEGGRNHIRPFSMSLESDSVFTLELQ